uniref:Vomeronasal type-1 receptor n=2 Tax=Tetraodon nigroviridis TaxID=99883 RepID=Q597G6_TETNG|nr:V1r pheromone receptor-like [Tetraodon nigroviridis]
MIVVTIILRDLLSISPGMQSTEFVRGILYLSLAVVGAPGNTCVILAYFILLYQEKRLLPADVIILHLACANLLVVVARCFLEFLASFRLALIFGDVGCKSVIFVYRTSRSLSIWLTFILSAYQCLCIAPLGSQLATLRMIVAKYLFYVFFFLWLLTTTMSTAAILFSFSTQNGTNLVNNSINVQFCYVQFPSKLSKDANGAAQVGRDVVPMTLMTLASLIILAFLYKNSQQVKGLRSSSSDRAEKRAAKAVVTLVSLYVLLYGVDNGLWVYTLTVREAMASSLISEMRIFFSSMYAALSPIVIIVSNRKVNNILRCAGQEKHVQEKTTTVSTV